MPGAGLSALYVSSHLILYWTYGVGPTITSVLQSEDFEARRDEEICSRLHICEVVELEFVSKQAGKLPKNILNWRKSRAERRERAWIGGQTTSGGEVTWLQPLGVWESVEVDRWRCDDVSGKAEVSWGGEVCSQRPEGWNVPGGFLHSLPALLFIL